MPICYVITNHSSYAICSLWSMCRHEWLKFVLLLHHWTTTLPTLLFHTLEFTHEIHTPWTHSPIPDSRYHRGVWIYLCVCTCMFVCMCLFSKSSLILQWMMFKNWDPLCITTSKQKTLKRHIQFLQFNHDLYSNL